MTIPKRALLSLLPMVVGGGALAAWFVRQPAPPVTLTLVTPGVKQVQDGVVASAGESFSFLAEGPGAGTLFACSDQREVGVVLHNRVLTVQVGTVDAPVTQVWLSSDKDCARPTEENPSLKVHVVLPR